MGDQMTRRPRLSGPAWTVRFHRGARRGEFVIHAADRVEAERLAHDRLSDGEVVDRIDYGDSRPRQVTKDKKRRN